MSDFVRTPRGLRHASLVHRIPVGARVRRENGKRTILSAEGEVLRNVSAAAGPGAMPVPPDGWISSADWTNASGQPVSHFATQWEVPPAPGTSDGQTIFLFNSLLDGGGTHILQPVLQWGPSAVPDAGRAWGVASWWVGQENDPAFITDFFKVAPGARLTGIIRLDSIGTNGLFNYTCEFAGIPQSRLTAENLPELTVCTETLETYNVVKPGDYPATPSTAFRSINVQTAAGIPAVTWSASGPVPPQIVTNSGNNGQIVIRYPTS